MTEKNCLFCKIYNEEEPAKIIYKDEDLVVFNDIRPASKNHFLIVPRVHVANAKELTKEQIPLVENLVKSGERVVLESEGDVEDSSHNMFSRDWPKCDSF